MTDTIQPTTEQIAGVMHRVCADPELKLVFDWSIMVARAECLNLREREIADLRAKLEAADLTNANWHREIAVACDERDRYASGSATARLLLDEAATKLALEKAHVRELQWHLETRKALHKEALDSLQVAESIVRNVREAKVECHYQGWDCDDGAYSWRLNGKRLPDWPAVQRELGVLEQQ